MDYSRICWIFAFVQIVSVLLQLFVLVESSTDVQCRSNEPAENNSSCLRLPISVSCWNNLPSNTVERLQECFPSHEEPVHYVDIDIDYGNNVDRGCFIQGNGFITDRFGTCTSSELNVSSTEAIYYKPKFVNSSITSAGIKTFDISVSWNLSENDLQRATSLQGYEIRVSKKKKGDASRPKPVDCICVRNTTQQSYDLPLRRNYLGNDDYFLMISVSTFPRTRSEPTELDTRDAPRDWPATCYSQGVVHTDQNCGPPRPNPPTNIQAIWSLESSSSEMSEDTARLDISWDPPLNTTNTSSYRTPHVYYFSVRPQPPEVGDGIRFQANNTRNVSVYGLNSTLQYTISIRSYEPRSGYVPVHANAIDNDVCSDIISIDRNPFEPPLVTTPIATTFMTTTRNKTTTGPTVGVVDNPQAAVHVIGISVGISVAILTVSILLGVVVVARYWSKRYKLPCTENSSSRYPPDFVPRVNCSCNVLVVFPLDTPSDKEKFIRARIGELEFYKDCSIKVDFIVDSKAGIVAVTWENQIRTATKILLISTPEFCREWANTSVESPNFTLFHLLKADLTSTVNDSNKYTAVTFNRNHSLPTNNLLSAIPRIDVESEADMDGLLSHITNTPRFLIVYPETVDVQPKAPTHYTISAASPVQPPEGPYNDLHCANIAYPPPCVHLNLEPRDLDSELSDLAISPTSDGTVETLSTSSSECSSIEMS